ncbi:transposase [Chloroflexota bacterium]
MFRARSPQGNLFQSAFLFPAEKFRRLKRSGAEMFQARPLPFIAEKCFAEMYGEDNSRPNRAVQIVLGVLVLKDMFNLTDEETLENLEFNLLWHHALRLTLEEAHLPRKLCNNFR